MSPCVISSERMFIAEYPLRRGRRLNAGRIAGLSILSCLVPSPPIFSSQEAIFLPCVYYGPALQESLGTFLRRQ